MYSYHCNQLCSVSESTSTKSHNTACFQSLTLQSDFKAFADHGMRFHTNPYSYNFASKSILEFLQGIGCVGERLRDYDIDSVCMELFFDMLFACFSKQYSIAYTRMI